MMPQFFVVAGNESLSSTAFAGKEWPASNLLLVKSF